MTRRANAGAEDAGDVAARLHQAEKELARYRDGMALIRSTCSAAARGDLEPRCPQLGDDAELVTTRLALNHLLDMTDAFVREAGTSLVYASAGKFYRRVLTRGFLGSFKVGAATINQATAAMAQTAMRLEEAAASRRALADAFKQAVQSVANSVVDAAGDVRTTATTLAASAGETAEQAAIVSSASARTSTSVTSIATATDELSSTMAEIERQLAVANHATEGAVHESGDATTTVLSLDTASRQIGEVITVINRVATQTRFLALNATIEAARAGSAGKGFAVVASEVKNLAGQTAEATETVARHIGAVQGLSKRTSTAIRTIADSIARVGQISSTITRAVGEQRWATGEISRNIQSTAMSVRDVSESIEHVTASTLATSASAAKMEEAASRLSQLGERLRHEVEHFLSQVRG